MIFSLGSPPRMRGKEFKNMHRTVTGGITPAYAGKSDLVGISSKQLQDHPRVCGEKSSMP